MAELNDRIKKRRLSLNMTLLYIAECLGVKEATVQRYESGEIKNIKHDTIIKLSKILKCSPSYLMGWENNLTYESGNMIANLMMDSELLGYIEKLMNMTDGEKQRVYGYIDSIKEK